MSECVPLHEANLKWLGKAASFSNALLSVKYYMSYKETGLCDTLKGTSYSSGTTPKEI